MDNFGKEQKDCPLRLYLIVMTSSLKYSVKNSDYHFSLFCYLFSLLNLSIHINDCHLITVSFFIFNSSVQTIFFLSHQLFNSAKIELFPIYQEIIKFDRLNFKLFPYPLQNVLL